MGQEIELKMLVDEADAYGLFCHPFILTHAQGRPVTKQLINLYFDTPEQTLRRNHMAFRIRFDGSRYVQTLKRKGRSNEGLSIRGEWEWPLNGPRIDTLCVPPDIWPPELRGGLDRLKPVFKTDFKRTRVVLLVPSESSVKSGDPARVEMALDRGGISPETGSRTAGGEKILEVEFELLDGEPSALLEIRKRLEEDIELAPSDISKAERGYRLLDCA
jgi:inorganic triphosphatase YgiF